MRTLAQKFSSLRTSLVATACGVVTTTAPARRGTEEDEEEVVLLLLLQQVRRVSASEMCSSEVPGGVSMRR